MDGYLVVYFVNKYSKFWLLWIIVQSLNLKNKLDTFYLQLLRTLYTPVLDEYRSKWVYLIIRYEKSLYDVKSWSEQWASTLRLLVLVPLVIYKEFSGFATWLIENSLFLECFLVFQIYKTIIYCNNLYQSITTLRLFCFQVDWYTMYNFSFPCFFGNLSNILYI